MKKILIAANADAATNPRPNRMILFLKDHYDVYYLGTGCINDPKVQYIPLPLWRKDLFHRIYKLIRVKLGRYESYLRFNNEEQLIAQLQEHQFNAVICHDLILLPLLSKVHKKIIFDAREYYPRHFKDRPLWRFFLQELNQHLCEQYLKLPAYCMTVSRGLADEYFRSYGVRMEVFLSLPYEYKCNPSEVNPANIRMIYHGNANPSRKIEIMIQVMEYVDERFSLDLMMVFTKLDRGYYRKLEKLVQKHKNVRIIPPVPFDEIIPKTNKYDIGFFFCLPSTFNLKHTMPNKLFEFVQARLAVAIGPSPDMREFVEKQGVGIAAEKFTPQAMASALNKLTAADVIKFKQKSDIAARRFNASTNKEKILKIVEKIV